MRFRGERNPAEIEKTESTEGEIDPQVVEIAKIFNDHLNTYVKGTGTETQDDAFRSAAIEAIARRFTTLPLHQQISLFKSELPAATQDQYMRHIMDQWQELDERGKVAEMIKMEAQQEGRVDKSLILPGSTVEMYLHNKDNHDDCLSLNEPFSFADDPYLYALILKKSEQDGFELQQLIPRTKAHVRMLDCPLPGEINIKTNTGSSVPTMDSYLYVGGEAFYSQQGTLHYLHYTNSHVDIGKYSLALGEIIIDGVPMFEDKIRRPSR